MVPLAPLVVMMTDKLTTPKAFRLDSVVHDRRLAETARASTAFLSPTNVPDEKPEESEVLSVKEEKVYETNTSRVIDRIHDDYEEYLAQDPNCKESSSTITLSAENKTPRLNILSRTAVFIQEESGDTAVASDLYGGNQNSIPSKEQVKITFILKSFDDSLPPVANADP
ncbi:hypothetical protein POX_f08016 [Penicillium oxalicum]|uniref:hypothetical protein n=1 Tax=Penicillium oxalicum TaxID=69781 RepID=UPI0020B78CF9|nr:hypothetical protein POX_f08016 [Penicillium oxalicum]KAI2787643.1 hypothetical protein POX_f08016 [Penicillium oxalicum]